MTGLVIHVLIGGLLIFAGSSKVFGLLPKEAVEGMAKYGLSDKLKLIGTGELITGILLIVPSTSSLGVLLASGFWGGVICFHMVHNESYVAFAILLILTWVGGYLRHPEMLSSFTARTAREA